MGFGGFLQASVEMGVEVLGFDDRRGSNELCDLLTLELLRSVVDRHRTVGMEMNLEP